MTKFESIPPFSKQEYLRRAADVVNEESEKVFRDLGTEVITHATDITRASAQAGEFVGEISTYKDTHDMTENFRMELEKPIETGVVDGAERFLEQNELSFETSPLNADPRHESDRAATLNELDKMIEMGDDELILGLTIIKELAPHRVNSHGESEFQTSHGKWINEEAIDKAHSVWGNNTAALQKAHWFLDRKSH